MTARGSNDSFRPVPSATCRGKPVAAESGARNEEDTMKRNTCSQADDYKLKCINAHLREKRGF